MQDYLSANEKPLFIIEPHADDAFISVGGHIKNLSSLREITIVTVFCDHKREREAREYAKSVGCQSVILNAKGHREMKSDGEGILVPELLEYLSRVSESEIIGPVGIQHPDHRSVSLSLPESALGYCDIPYYTKLKNQSEASERVSGREVVSILCPGKRKWRHASIFKTQSKFFHFNPLQDFKIPEIVLSQIKNPD